MPDLNDGESMDIPGSSGISYTIRNVGGVYSCTCPAWQTQLIPHPQRTCKHIRRLRGDAAEDARIGRFAPPPPPKANSAPQTAPPQAQPVPAGPPAAVRLTSPRETEAVLTEYFLTNDRFSGFRCRLGDGQPLTVTGGITDRVRDCPPPIGGIVTLRYQQVSNTGVPVAASYAGMRPNDAATLPLPPKPTS
jgi:DNA ligase-1